MKPAASAAPPTPSEATLAAAYARRREAASAVAGGDVRPLSGDPIQALQTVLAVVAKLRPLRAKLAELPGFDLDEAFAATDYAFGLVHAAGRVDRLRSDGALPAQIRRARALRRTLLASAQILAASGLLPRAKVDEIGRHATTQQGVADCGTLAQLFRRKAKSIAGKHPITEAEIDEAIALSTALAREIRPAGSRRVRRATGARAEAIGLRDRFWTLLWNSYEELWRGGAYLWGRTLVAERIPRLGSGGRRKLRG
jgi:hypothetical protein